MTTTDPATLTPTDRIDVALDAIDEVTNAATLGPWNESDHRQFWEGGCIRPHGSHAICVFLNGWNQTIQDRHFIAQSRNTVPALTAALREAKDALSKVDLYHPGDVSPLNIWMIAEHALATIADTLEGLNDDPTD